MTLSEHFIRKIQVETHMEYTLYRDKTSFHSFVCDLQKQLVGEFLSSFESIKMVIDKVPQYATVVRFIPPFSTRNRKIVKL